MNRNTWLALMGVALLALAGGLYWRLRPKTTTTATLGGQPAALLPEGMVEHDNGFGEKILVKPTEDKTWLARYYQRPYVQEYYDTEGSGMYPTVSDESYNHAPLPAFDYEQPLVGKSYLDLLLLRNTVYARNGYCFMNATARRHFGKQKWYRPLWYEPRIDTTGHALPDVPLDTLLPVPLNKRELAFVQRVQAEENRLLAGRIRPQGGYDMLGLDFVVNHREEPLNAAMRPVLSRHNFVLAPTREEQLFYIYDQNQYTFTPSFVTTDLVLQLLHKHLNGILSDVEEKRLVPVVTTLLREGHQQAQALARRSQGAEARTAAAWAAAYYAVGQGLITGARPAVEGEYAAAVPPEMAAATAAEGRGSGLLADTLYDYSALKPRGMYTRTDTTRRYFRAVKWLNTAPVFLDSDAGLLRAVALAQAVAASPAAGRSFGQFSRVLDVLVGDEDNRSLTQLLKLLSTQYPGQTLDQLAAPATLARLRQQFVATGTDRIRAHGATAPAVAALARPKMLLTAGRYTFDAEVLQRLVNVTRPAPGQVPPRPFPKGLDVFATFGNAAAQDVLLKHYQEAAHWPAYPDTLRALQQQFASYKNWDQNLYTKTMQLLLTLQQPSPDKNAPLCMRTPAWQKRTLSTALAGWAELKHDLLLYTEQPSAAEAGGGGLGPPPPQHLGYVEPNLAFWDGALALLALQEQRLTRLQANTEHLAACTKEIRDLVTKLRNLTRKEIAHQPLTNAEMDEISWIGGEVERITLSILKVDHFPDREKHIGLVADVYAFNEDFPVRGVLEEGVGTVDVLYAVVEINGTPVLARGAAFSYYEFVSPARLTDEEWKAQLVRQAPARPSWLQEFIVPSKVLSKAKGNPMY